MFVINMSTFSSAVSFSSFFLFSSFKERSALDEMTKHSMKKLYAQNIVLITSKFLMTVST